MNGPGPAVPHLPEGEPEHFGYPRPFEDRSAPFDSGLEGIELVLALEGGRRRGIAHSHPVLRSDRQHGNAFVQRGEDAGQQIGRTRAGVADHTGSLSGRLVEALGHVDAGRFMPYRDQPDPVLLKLGKEGIDLGRRQAEDMLDSFAGQASCEEFAAGDLGHRCSLLSEAPCGAARGWKPASLPKEGNSECRSKSPFSAHRAKVQGFPAAVRTVGMSGPEDFRAGGSSFPG